MAPPEPEWTLKPHATFPRGQPVLVCIMDGWGENAGASPARSLPPSLSSRTEGSRGPRPQPNRLPPAVLDEYNAVYSADTPTVDALRSAGVPGGRWRTVKAHGPAVGLPTWDDMGNSEVGHNALGAGQLIAQGASLVDKALADGSLVGGAGWAYVRQAFAGHTLHLIGLLSAGGVHSRSNQLFSRARRRPGRAAEGEREWN